MSMKKIIEIFLFVDPLNKHAVQDEKTIVEFLEERKEKIRVRIIPLVNLQTIGRKLQEEEKKQTLEERNRHYHEAYHVGLAFQAASMQGKKRGRNFLFALQKQIQESNASLSQEMMLEAANQVRLDMEMFEEDLESDLAKRAFLKDQELAQEMNVAHVPTSVVFQGADKEYGYRIEASLTKTMLHQLCDMDADTPKLEAFAPHKVTLQIV